MIIINVEKSCAAHIKYNIYIKNMINVFRITFDKCNKSLLNKKTYHKHLNGILCNVLQKQYAIRGCSTVCCKLNMHYKKYDEHMYEFFTNLPCRSSGPFQTV